MSQLRKIFLTATIAVVTVGVAMPAGSASALTAAELQAQINALLAQLNALQAQLSQVQGTPTGTGACAGITFSRNLSVGSSGSDVKCLQSILNQSADTQVAASGVGSAGNESTYFGNLTKAAVVKFQNKYASEILAPVGLSAGTGFVGASTRAKLNTMVGAAPSPTPTPTPTPGPTPPPVTTGSFVVSLAADTPAASSIVAGQALAPLAKFGFSNGTSSEVKVTGLKMSRIGVSNDTTLSNIFLFEGATRLTDAASVSESKITMSSGAGIITIPANSSKTISVLADIATGTSGQTVGVAIKAAADVTATATATGIFPLNGNLMTVATATLATVDYGATTTPSSNTTTDPVNDYALWQNNIAIGTRAVNMTRFSIREIGSVEAKDIQNLRLYIDGVQVGSAVSQVDANGYATFDLTASPKKLDTGTRQFILRGDIIGGSNLNTIWSVRNAADATYVDSQFGVNILPTANSATFSARETATISINAGTVTVSKRSDSPAGDVIKDASQVVLARYDVKAAGEAVKIENLEFSVASSRNTITELRNGAVFVNGVQVGSTADLAEEDASTSSTTYNLGAAFIAQPGVTYLLEVKADIFDSDGTNNVTAADTLQIKLQGSSSENNGFAQVSNTIVDVPSADVNANTVTVRTGSLTLVKYTGYSDQTVVLPVTNYKMSHFVITSTSTESVNLTDITFDYLTSAVANASNIYATLGTDTLPTKATVSATGNSWSLNKTMAPGTSLDLIFYTTVSSSETAAEATFHANVTGITAGSATTVYAATGGAAGSREEGQTITWGSGSFQAEKDGSTPLNNVTNDNQRKTVGAFKFTAQNDSYTVKEIKFRVAASVSSAISSLVLVDGTTDVQTQSFTQTDSNTLDTAFFQGLSVAVAANTSKILKVDANFAEVTGTNSASSGRQTQLTMTHLKHASSNGTETSDTTPGPGNSNPASNSTYAFASYPTFTDATTASTFVNGVETTYMKFKVKANGGPVALHQLRFNTTISDNGTAGSLGISTFKLFQDGVNITGNVTITDQFKASVEGTTTVGENSGTIVWVIWDDDNEGAIASGAESTFELKGTSEAFTTSSTGNDTVSFALTNGSNDTSSTVRSYLATQSAGADELGATAGITNGSGTAADIIWSDNSATLHSSSTGSDGTADWHNGYLLQSLPISRGWSLQ